MSNFPKCPKCGSLINSGMKRCAICGHTTQFHGGMTFNNSFFKKRPFTVKKYYLDEVQFTISMVALAVIFIAIFLPYINLPGKGTETILTIKPIYIQITWFIYITLLSYGVYKKDGSGVLFLGVLGVIDSIFKQIYLKNLIDNFTQGFADVAGKDLIGIFASTVANNIAQSVTFEVGYYVGVIGFVILVFAGLYGRNRNFIETIELKYLSNKEKLFILFCAIAALVSYFIYSYLTVQRSY